MPSDQCVGVPSQVALCRALFSSILPDTTDSGCMRAKRIHIPEVWVADVVARVCQGWGVAPLDLVLALGSSLHSLWRQEPGGGSCGEWRAVLTFGSWFG